jgi:hypothetical protein
MLSVAFALAHAAISQATIVLYSNDFETPNVPIMVNCGNSLDTRTIDSLYGQPGFSYQQTNTVEAVVLDDPSNLYSNPSGEGGLYALGMLSTVQDDMLALTFDAMGRDFVNVGFNLSSIDVSGCGGPFGTNIPIMQVTLYDTPTGSFSFGVPAVQLAQGTATGTLAPSQFTFAWTYETVNLDASAATVGPVTVVFNLLQSGYASFDNVSIVASNTAGIVDRDNDTIADDQDNCPDDGNLDQADVDGDGVGDVCDPAPNDPTICGDRSGDGIDDCTPADAGVEMDAGPTDTGTSSPPLPTDTGIEMDAQTQMDAESQMDAQPIDTGVAMDSGMGMDAYPDDGVEVGPRDSGLMMEDVNDCDCSAVETRNSSPIYFLLLGLFIVRRRRGSRAARAPER